MAASRDQHFGSPDMSRIDPKFNDLARSSSPFIQANSMPPTDKPLRILCVDDNLINLRVLTMLIQRRFNHLLACPPVAVDSGLKAIQNLRNDVFDIIFLDVQMPFLSGVECARRIRAGADGILPGNTTATICAVTTCVSPDAVATYRTVGMDGVIPKPVRLDQLKEFLASSSTGILEGTPLHREISQSLVSPLLHGSFGTVGNCSSSDVGQQRTTRAFFAKPVSQAATLASPLSADMTFEVDLNAETRASLRSTKSVSIPRPPSLQRFSSLPRGVGSANKTDTFNIAPYDESTLQHQINREIHSVLLYDLQHRVRRSSSPPTNVEPHRSSTPSDDSNPNNEYRYLDRQQLASSPRSGSPPAQLTSSEVSQISSVTDLTQSYSSLRISIPHDQRRASSGTSSSNGSSRSESSLPAFEDHNVDDTDSCAETPLSSPPALLFNNKFWATEPSPPSRQVEANQ